ncbi:MAG: CrcB family protein [Bifidobacteriaceae bacterium]|jgi:CrcB protein|nr:CrcB family protein [Bifidobacteriaceae bacterium]
MVLWLALAGGVGAGLRFLVDRIVAAAWPRPHYSWGTWVVNLAGSAALGSLVGAGMGDGRAALILGTGLLGGFTTFSTASVEAARLALAGVTGAEAGEAGGQPVLRAAGYAAGMAGACLVAALLGMAAFMA